MYLWNVEHGKQPVQQFASLRHQQCAISNVLRNWTEVPRMQILVPKDWLLRTWLGTAVIREGVWCVSPAWLYILLYTTVWGPHIFSQPNAGAQTSCANPTELACWFTVSQCEAVFQIVCLALWNGHNVPCLPYRWRQPLLAKPWSTHMLESDAWPRCCSFLVWSDGLTE